MPLLLKRVPLVSETLAFRNELRREIVSLSNELFAIA